MSMPRRRATCAFQLLALIWLCLMGLGGSSLAQTETVSFDFDGFTEISVSSVFKVTATQGQDFVVEVTIDEDKVDSLDVTQTGTRLDFGLLPGVENIETIEARVTLPLLDSIDLDGVVRAILSGFNQTQLAVDVDGTSQLLGSSLRISDLTASVSGVSALDFGDISPLETASISVSGVSTATLNMNINSSLTGSVSGVSTLFYYGTNVAVSVETGIGSSLSRLGDTRPGGFAERLYFAQFGNGEGFISDVVLTNPSASEIATGKLDFLDDNGDPLLVGIVNVDAATTTLAADPLESNSSVDFSVQPLGVVTISTDGLGGVVVGSAVVSSNGGLGGVIRFFAPGIGIAGVGASQPLDHFIVPVRRTAAGINSGLAVHSTESQPVTLHLTLRDSQGLQFATRTIENFRARGHLARFIDELFPDADTDGFVGTLTVEVEGGAVASTALELGSEAGQFTTLPVTPLE